MKSLSSAFVLLLAASAAQAQVFPQAPGYPPGYARPGVGAPLQYAPARPEGDEGYWRGRNREDWRRREEYRDEARREEWVRSHCVRDYRGEEYCRR